MFSRKIELFTFYALWMSSNLFSLLLLTNTIEEKFSLYLQENFLFVYVCVCVEVLRSFIYSYFCVKCICVSVCTLYFSLNLHLFYSLLVNTVTFFALIHWMYLFGCALSSISSYSLSQNLPHSFLRNTVAPLSKNPNCICVLQQPVGRSLDTTNQFQLLIRILNIFWLETAISALSAFLFCVVCFCSFTLSLRKKFQAATLLP